MKKTAIVTGSSRGIGFAIAKQLGLDGYNIVMVATGPQEKNQHALDELKAMGIDCAYVQANIGSTDDRKKILDGALAAFGRVDVLVNNAGISYIGLLSDMSAEEWRRVIATNLDSCFYTCRNAIPLMVHAKQGRIINISSVWGQAGASMETAYSASKGAVNSFTRALAKELVFCKRGNGCSH